MVVGGGVVKKSSFSFAVLFFFFPPLDHQLQILMARKRGCVARGRGLQRCTFSFDVVGT